jgi:thiol-disulfide isomerase/thioredoxin
VPTQGGSQHRNGAASLATRSDTAGGAIVNFWASTCSACLQEMPDLQEAQKDPGSSVAFMGLDVSDPAGPATAFAARSRATYPAEQLEYVLHTLEDNPQ